MKKYKSWAGRFNKETSPLMDEFNASIGFDKRLYNEDIDGSIAYAEALRKAEIITQKEKRLIVKALTEIKKEFETGIFKILPTDEDIHMAVERRLVEKIGAAGQKIHTGRSRNDQVQLDTRLYLKKSILNIINDIANLQKSIVSLSENNIETVIPGYTHLQQAQPVLLAHYLLSFFWGLERDKERLSQNLKRTDVLALGSGAVAGTSFDIDRELLRKLLGFNSISKNSLDTVADRDYIIEFLANCSIIMTRLSRYAEDLIIWASAEFGYVEIDDTYATGSSMLPQKKNPDSLELIRGKSGRVFGSLTTILTALKGLPLAYCKDLQEDKEPMFDTIDTVSICLKVFSGVLDTLKINEETIKSKLSEYIIAIDISDYLVKKGMPFRKSHSVIGKIIRYSIESGIPLSKIELKTYKKYSNLFSSDIYDVLNIKKSINTKKTAGSTSTASVKKQLSAAKRRIK